MSCSGSSQSDGNGDVLTAGVVVSARGHVGLQGQAVGVPDIVGTHHAEIPAGRTTLILPALVYSQYGAEAS